MATIQGLDGLILTFVKGVESAVTQHVTAQIKGKILAAFGDEAPAKTVKPAKAAKAAKVKTPGGSMKPSPVSGQMNNHRKFSFLMPEERTPENLAKYNAKAIKAAAKEAKRLAKSSNHVDEGAPLQ